MSTVQLKQMMARKLAPRVHKEAPRTAPAAGANVAPAVKPGAVAQKAPARGEPNPYLDARREWNERYGDYIHQAQHWRTMAIVSGLVSLVCVIGVCYIGSRSKVVPYIVEVDKMGDAVAVGRADRAPTVDTRVIKAYLARFVVDWRSVTIDRQAQKAAVDRVYSMVPRGSIAVSKMSEYFRANNPFSAAAKETVAASVTNVLPISEKTWQIEWEEVSRDTRGSVLNTVRMKASILVGVTSPTSESQILLNPLGVYITDINWSQQL